jgi:hypothetical protein
MSAEWIAPREGRDLCLGEEFARLGFIRFSNPGFGNFTWRVHGNALNDRQHQ